MESAFKINILLKRERFEINVADLYPKTRNLPMDHKDNFIFKVSENAYRAI